MPQWEYCTLNNDQTYLFYTLYQQDGLHTIKKPLNDSLWSWCISTLGLIGWEATGTTVNSVGIAWHFKRILDPSNETLQLQ